MTYYSETLMWLFLACAQWFKDSGGRTSRVPLHVVAQELSHTLGYYKRRKGGMVQGFLTAFTWKCLCMLMVISWEWAHKQRALQLWGMSGNLQCALRLSLPACPRAFKWFTLLEHGLFTSSNSMCRFHSATCPKRLLHTAGSWQSVEE